MGGMHCHQCGQEESQSTYLINETHPDYAEVNASVIRMIGDMQGYEKILKTWNLTNLIGMNESSLQSMMDHGEEDTDYCPVGHIRTSLMHSSIQTSQQKATMTRTRL